MSDGAVISVSECSPKEAWAALESSPDCLMIDVRTRPEWSFVGVPDLTSIGHNVILKEWRKYPDMSVNAEFADHMLIELGERTSGHAYFICRSGQRSMEAAKFMAEIFARHGKDFACVNVAEGFEGDLNSDGHRGNNNGWKAHGLPWRQT